MYFAVPARSVVPWTHDVTVEEILVQPHVLACQLPPPKIPQHAKGVIYVVEPLVIACICVVGPFASQ